MYGLFDGRPIQKYLGEKTDKTLFYIVGPPGMVEETREFLKIMKVEDVDIRTEGFWVMPQIRKLLTRYP